MTVMLFSLELAFGFLLLYLRITLGSFDFSGKFYFWVSSQTAVLTEDITWIKGRSLETGLNNVMEKKPRGIFCFHLRRLTIAPICSLGKFYTKISASRVFQA